MSKFQPADIFKPDILLYINSPDSLVAHSDNF